MALETELCLVTVTPSMGLSQKGLEEFPRTENVSLGDVLDAEAERILARAKSRAVELGENLRPAREERFPGDPSFSTPLAVRPDQRWSACRDRHRAHN